MEMVKGKMVKVPIEKDPGYEIVRIPPFKGTQEVNKPEQLSCSGYNSVKWAGNG
jgi:hypothetical protein